MKHFINSITYEQAQLILVVWLLVLLAWGLLWV